MIIRSCKLNGRSGHDAGRELLATLYREQTNGQLPQILATDRGKPYFADSPLCFSISHTRNYAFCALSDQNIGIDAEELSRKIDPRLAGKILSPGELAQYQTAKDKNRALLTFWVLKEAAAKLSGQGLQGYPNDTNFSLDDPRVIETEGCLLAILTEIAKEI